jgi:hypothetical protein
MYLINDNTDYNNSVQYNKTICVNKQRENNLLGWQNTGTCV